MTIRIGSAPAVLPAIAPTAEQQPVSAPVSPSVGHPATSAFEGPKSASFASTGSSGGPGPETTRKAIEILKNTSGGEKLRKLFESGYILKPEIEEAAEMLKKLDLSEDDAKVVGDALQFEAAVTGSIELGKMMMNNMMEQMKARSKQLQDEMFT